MFDGSQIDKKFEGKLTFAFKNDMRNLGNFHQTLESLNIWTLMRFFQIHIRKGIYMSLKLTGELFVMTMKNDAKLVKELTCHFKIEMSTLTNFGWSSRKSQKFAL